MNIRPDTGISRWLSLPPLAQWWKYVLLGLAALPCLALVYSRNPEEAGFYPPCFFFAVTGLHCPGCGTLRGLHQLLNGNLLAAIGYNPLTMLVLPLIAGAIVAFRLAPRCRQLAWVGRLAAASERSAAVWVLLAAVVCFWVLRNVPAYPFNILAP